MPVPGHPPTPPPIVVVVTLYNSEATIAQTIASLRCQTFTGWRCVVVNDGSTDAGPAIVERTIREDDRFEMITQANSGLPGARNTGIERAIALRCRFVNFLDSDDTLEPRGLEWLHGAAQRTGASYGGYEFLDAAGRPLGRQSPISVPVVGLDEQLDWNRTMTHAHLFSRESIGDTRFDPAVKVAEDYDMWLRLAVKGVRWQAVERIVAGYRLRPASISKDFRAMCSYFHVVLRKAFVLARESEWKGKIDLSEERYVRTVGGTAFAYATMEALLDPMPNKARAAKLYDESAHPPRLTPAQMAQSASNALPFGLCTAPDLDGSRERSWLIPLRRWWVCCAEEGWIDYDDIEAGFFELSRKIVHPDRIAASMLDQGMSPGGTVAVIGLDKNGRRLARRAAERGGRVVAFDDWSDRAETVLLEPIDNVRVIREAAEWRQTLAQAPAPMRWFVGAPGRDADSAIARAEAGGGARAPAVERWDEHRDRLGDANHEMIRAALHVRRAKAG